MFIKYLTLKKYYGQRAEFLILKVDSSFHQCVMSDSLFVHVDIDAVFRNLISVKNP